VKLLGEASRSYLRGRSYSVSMRGHYKQGFVTVKIVLVKHLLMGYQWANLRRVAVRVCVCARAFPCMFFWRGFCRGVDDFADGKPSVCLKISFRLGSSSPEVSMKV
jgi:hypothetical protein